MRFAIRAYSSRCSVSLRSYRPYHLEVTPRVSSALAGGAGLGASEEKLVGLPRAEENPQYSDLERPATSLAREVTLSVRPTEKTWSTVHGEQVIDKRLNSYSISASITSPRR
jgi:hypothetical protein